MEWYELRAIPEQTIEDFAQKYGLKMVVTERTDSNSYRYYAAFEGVEVMSRGMLRSEDGNGSTPEIAIANYAKAISLERIAVNAYKKDRREIQVPRIIESKEKQ